MKTEQGQGRAAKAAVRRRQAELTAERLWALAAKQTAQIAAKQTARQDARRGSPRAQAEAAQYARILAGWEARLRRRPPGQQIEDLAARVARRTRAARHRPFRSGRAERLLLRLVTIGAEAQAWNEKQARSEAEGV